MTLTEIVTAVQQGKKVYYGSLTYQVVYDMEQGYFIQNSSTHHKISLTWEDGRTLNGKEENFFIEQKNQNIFSIVFY